MTSSKKTAQKTSGDAATLPLFFKSPMALSLDRHAQAGINRAASFAFARATNSMPLSVSEFVEAAKFYPIGFTQGEQVMPIVILGLEQENTFINAEGEWRLGSYIPAYARKYPFVFLEAPESDQLILCVDEGAPHYVGEAKAEDQRFYDGEKPSEFTQNVLSFMGAVQGQFELTRRFCDKLESLGLLKPHQSEAKIGSRVVQLGGFQLIDQEKFHALDDKTLVDLHKEGFLPLVYYALQSLSNWPRLASDAQA